MPASGNSRSVGPGSDKVGLYRNKTPERVGARALTPSLAAPGLLSSRPQTAPGRSKDSKGKKASKFSRLHQPDEVVEDEHFSVITKRLGDRPPELLGAARDDEDGQVKALPWLPHDPSSKLVTQLEPDFLFRGEASTHLMSDLKLFLEKDSDWRENLVKFTHFYITGSWHASAVRRYIQDVEQNRRPLPENKNQLPVQVPFDAISLAKFSTAKEKIKVKDSDSTLLSGYCWDPQEIVTQDLEEFVTGRFFTPRTRQELEKKLGEHYRVPDVLTDASAVSLLQAKKPKNLKRDQTVVLDLLA
ncbi:unnamed protein product, partial [Amoebophrya sp. A120]|eukprot:GSA120T00005195001.1